jgi:heme/copper-type cytochrome/quinol oxidase subunit 3
MCFFNDARSLSAAASQMIADISFRAFLTVLLLRSSRANHVRHRDQAGDEGSEREWIYWTRTLGQAFSNYRLKIWPPMLETEFKAGFAHFKKLYIPT